MNVINLQIPRSLVEAQPKTPASCALQPTFANASPDQGNVFGADDVGGCMVRDLISLPSWFPAGQAAAILRQKKTAFVLVTDRTGLAGVASACALSAAPATKSLGWCAKALAEAVTAELSREQALALMDMYAVDWLPVIAGISAGATPTVVRAGAGVIVGIVTRQMASVQVASPAVVALAA